MEVKTLKDQGDCYSNFFKSAASQGCISLESTTIRRFNFSFCSVIIFGEQFLRTWEHSNHHIATTINFSIIFQLTKRVILHI